MMICEKCQTELPTSIGACTGCGHNPVLQRMDEWREKRTQKLTSFSQSSTSRNDESQSPIRAARASAKDATLIRFPQRAATPPPPSPPPAVNEVVPVWKERLNSRLQELRDQREPSTTPSRVEEKFDRNPIIVNALNRINRANYLPATTPLPRSRSAAAAELLPVTEPAPQSSPYLEAKAGTATQFMARTGSTSYPEVHIEPLIELAPSPIEPEEDLLSEIHLDPVAPAAELSSPPVKAEADPLIATHTSLEAASLGKRAAAAVIDAEIIASSLLPLFGAYFFLSGWFEAPTIYVPVLVAVALITVYYFVTYALAGRTMGMAWCNLHLASLSTNAETHMHAAPSTITFTIKQASLRAIGGTISLLLFPLNILCIARSDDRLSISDYLSETQVVRIRK